MRGKPSTHASNRGLDLPKHHAATMKNTVVGKPGTMTPIEPVPTAHHPPTNHPARATRPRSEGTGGRGNGGIT
jgi:hypothetical protein